MAADGDEDWTVNRLLFFSLSLFFFFTLSHPSSYGTYLFI